MTRSGDGGHAAAGTVSVFTGGRVELDLGDAALAAWARDALAAISSSRTPQFFKDGEGRFPISFVLLQLG